MMDKYIPSPNSVQFEPCNAEIYQGEGAPLKIGGGNLLYHQ